MRILAAAVLTTSLIAPTAVLPDEPRSILPELELPDRMDDALRRMMEDLKPALDETMKLMESFEAIGDPRHYHLPEVLPNGDIILRRKEDAPPFQPPETDAPEDDEGIKT